MALSEGTLASGLQTMVPTMDEGEAITRLVNAWASYFEGAEVLGVPADSLDGASSAMEGALGALNVDGAVGMQAGVVAFWGVVTSAAATIWVFPPNLAGPAVPPPGAAGIAAALLPVFSANVASNASLEEATENIAAVLHSLGGQGGTVTVTPPPPASPFVEDIT